MFWLVHGVFVFLLPRLRRPLDRWMPSASRPMDFGPLPLEGLALSALALAASHGVSFFVNYLGRREYLRVSPERADDERLRARLRAPHHRPRWRLPGRVSFGTPFAALVLLVGSSRETCTPRHRQRMSAVYDLRRTVRFATVRPDVRVRVTRSSAAKTPRGVHLVDAARRTADMRRAAASGGGRPAGRIGRAQPDQRPVSASRTMRACSTWWAAG